MTASVHLGEARLAANPAHALQERSARIAAALRAAARAERVRVPAEQPKAQTRNLVPRAAVTLQHASLSRAFLAIVAVPGLLWAMYSLFLAASLYAAELKFTVRNTSAPLAAMALNSGGAQALTPLVQAQDTFIIVNYLTSRAAAEAIGAAAGARALFDVASLDPLAGISASASPERFAAFWARRISVHVESLSGIVTVEATAYRPEDALALAQAIEAGAEKLINELPQAARARAAAGAETELKRAEARLGEVRSALQALRDASGMLDPASAAKGIDALVAQLRLQEAMTSEQIATARRSLSADAPQIRALQARRDAIAQQIDLLSRELTRAEGDGAPISARLSAFETLALQKSVAERRYAAAAAAFEQAEADLTRPRVHLSVFVAPVLPQEAKYPGRIWQTLAGLAALMAVFALYAAVRNALARRHA